MRCGDGVKDVIKQRSGVDAKVIKGIRDVCPRLVEGHFVHKTVFTGGQLFSGDKDKDIRSACLYVKPYYVLNIFLATKAAVTADERYAIVLFRLEPIELQHHGRVHHTACQLDDKAKGVCFPNANGGPGPFQGISHLTAAEPERLHFILQSAVDSSEGGERIAFITVYLVEEGRIRYFSGAARLRESGLGSDQQEKKK